MLKTSLLVALFAFLQIFDPNLLLLLLHVLYSSCFYITCISITDTNSILHVLVGDISIIFPCSFAVGITQQYGIYVLLG